ncbi:hypothetical protein MKZ38_004004 [Zalerion maritima]|uniref:Uncharacterized protein n=1 Tax=Zalerion maritima TaxID=339359 RepID=A0AAD5RMW6_9PEZI|nr:hypothetical protein MKZ38_004004 [Zalerion maritima]
MVATTRPHEGGPVAGSLTTIFTFPASCGPMIGGPRGQNIDCAPPGWSVYTKETWGWHQGFYSPAICPEGYTIACSRPLSGAHGPLPEWTEEAYMCLPRGYDCDLSTTLIGTNEDGYAAPYLQIRWAQSDLEILETHPLHAVEAQTAPADTSITTGNTDTDATGPTPTEAPSTSVPSETASASVDTEHGDNGLSMAAKAGIGVGVSVGVLIATLIAVVVWRQCRRKKEEDKESNPGTHSWAGPASWISSPIASSNQHAVDHGANGPDDGLQVVQSPISPTIRFHTPSHLSPSLGPLGQNPTHGQSVIPQPAMELPSDGNELTTLPLPPAQLDSAENPVVGVVGRARDSPQSEPVELPSQETSIAPALSTQGARSISKGHETPIISPYVQSETTESVSQSELASLYRRATELQAKRERLVQLKQVDEEQEMVRQRIAELQQAVGEVQ